VPKNEGCHPAEVVESKEKPGEKESKLSEGESWMMNEVRYLAPHLFI
jgi:hypothetical protein